MKQYGKVFGVVLATVTLGWLVTGCDDSSSPSSPAPAQESTYDDGSGLYMHISPNGKMNVSPFPFNPSDPLSFTFEL